MISIQIVKYSSARMEDYKNMQKVIDYVAWYVLKHCSTRWFTIIKVMVKIVEQWKNFCEYFLKFMPEQKNFKKEIKDTVHYKWISECLKSKLNVSYLSFVVFLAIDFEKFLISFQSNALLYHLWNNKSVKVWNVF